MSPAPLAPRPLIGLVSEARCPICRSELVAVCDLRVGAKGWATCKARVRAAIHPTATGGCQWDGAPVISRIDGLYMGNGDDCDGCNGDGWAAETHSSRPLEEYQPCHASGCIDGERRRVELDRYRRALALEEK